MHATKYNVGLSFNFADVRLALLDQKKDATFIFSKEILDNEFLYKENINPDEKIKTIISTWVKYFKLSKGQINITVPKSLVLQKTIELALHLDGDAILKAIYEDFMSEFSKDDWIIDFVQVKENNFKKEIKYIAIKKSLLKKILILCYQCGLEVKVVDVDVNAVKRFETIKIEKSPFLYLFDMHSKTFKQLTIDHLNDFAAPFGIILHGTIWDGRI